MPGRSDDDGEIWVPVTLHLPLGFTKSLSPASCTTWALLVGPFSIITLAQMANTVLVPVLPFLVRDVGASAVAYGVLQSAMWTSQTFLSPVHGWLSDRFGRRPVIVLTLLISAGGNGLLAIANSVPLMVVARVISGLGFQIALFRAYFADTAPRAKRAGKFGLIGVVQSFALFAGPSIGGFVASFSGRRSAALLASVLCLLGAFLAVLWQPEEQHPEVALERESSTANMTPTGEREQPTAVLVQPHTSSRAPPDRLHPPTSCSQSWSSTLVRTRLSTASRWSSSRCPKWTRRAMSGQERDRRLG